jgi:hypothetical protein
MAKSALSGPAKTTRLSRRGAPASSGWLPSPIGQALLLAAATRAALFTITWMSLRIFPRFDPYPAQLPDNFLPRHPFLDGWARWDTSHYVAVAQLGYGDPASPSPHGGLGFFPLYPLLMRAVVAITGVEPTAGAYAAAGIVISNICFFVAVALLAWFGLELAGERAALNAVLLFCVAPFSYFFNAAYSESLFFAIALLSLWLGRRERWWAAGLVAALGSATRLVGLAIGPALLYLAYRRGAQRRDLIAIALLSPAGLVAYFLYCALKFDDLFAYFTAQSEWGGWDEHVRFYAELFFTKPREAIGGDERNLIIILNVALLALFVALLPLVWRRLDPGTALFTTLLVVVQGAITWVSLGRYLMPAFGVFLVGGILLTHPRLAGWPRDAIVASSALLLSLLTVLFAHGFWTI